MSAKKKSAMYVSLDDSEVTLDEPDNYSTSPDGILDGGQGNNSSGMFVDLNPQTNANVLVF